MDPQGFIGVASALGRLLPTTPWVGGRNSVVGWLRPSPFFVAPTRPNNNAGDPPPRGSPASFSPRVPTQVAAPQSALPRRVRFGAVPLAPVAAFGLAVLLVVAVALVVEALASGGGLALGMVAFVPDRARAGAGAVAVAVELVADFLAMIDPRFRSRPSCVMARDTRGRLH